MITTSPVLERQLQHERVARALTGLQRGEMLVTALNGSAWNVDSKGNVYMVSQTGETWSCTCPDFSGRCRQFGLFCKHIAAVRLTQVEQIADAGLQIPYTNPLFSTPNTEEPMTITMQPPDPPMLDASYGQMLHRLRQPLDMNRVKRRQAPGQGTVPFLEGHDVIEAANEVFQFCWSFDLLGEPHIMRWDKATTFYDQRLKKRALVLGEDGQPITEIAGVVYITGRVIVELDGKPYSHADAGRCIFTGDTPEVLDMAIAGAVTDCLKRCFRQLGEQFGLSLYDKEVARTA
ncbi:MAG TPA: Rad52/Rad22 family DNA repair protein, partial [Anaerolinea sp.]|nr:Rad52/Rad22 family DNA repair protein [Anaerolinea sp.]